MTVCLNLLRCSCLVSAVLICVCVCLWSRGSGCACAIYSLIKSSILNVNLREIYVYVSSVQLEVNVEFKGKL